MLGLSDGERISMIRSAVLTQYTRVTDGRTDGIGVAYTRYSIHAVARKNLTLLVNVQCESKKIPPLIFADILMIFSKTVGNFWSRVRTILALGYWVLPNIFQYWVALGIGQYFYWLSYPIPIPLGHLDTSCQQTTAGKLGRTLYKARVLANKGTQN